MPEIDFAAIVIGPPKCGKTTVQRRLVADHLTRHPQGIAIVHDTQRQYRDMCQSYETAGDYLRAAKDAQRSGARISRGVAITGSDSAQVADLAYGLGKLHNTGSDDKPLPIFLAWDETSVLDATGSTYVGKRDWEIATTRRHLGIATAHNCQRTSSLPKNMFEVCTDVYICKLTNEDAAEDLEKKLGAPRGQLRGLVNGAPFKVAHWRAGQGFV